ncbi:hypothetical protein NECAME_07618 [Necator americanus]|uniref:Metallo-beta-lactamase domain-containing protein n=1 Tax=Necator americanus TaxID=51031 RepID=W2TMS4_NECAM|nr:hypothetical protein NECAME_07618 [Necator americanus]ETN82964.1 hypothetical protein NECAME_07618 [Necator americanus]
MTSSSSRSPSDFAKPLRDNGRFANPPSFDKWTGVPGFWNLLKWRLFEKDNSNIPDDNAELDEVLPVHNVTKFESKSKAGMFAAWLGHATVLVQMEDIRGEHDSFKVDDKNVTVWCLPSQHWGQRGAFDRNKRLWSGWAVVTPNRRFYYTGDTGYCDREFKKIGSRLGPFDLAAIPIGAYSPRWFMKSQHIDPHEAVAIHDLVRSKFSVGIHWGTYHMGSYEVIDMSILQYYLEPKELLNDIMQNRTDLPPFVTLEMGQIWEESQDSNEDTTLS